MSLSRRMVLGGCLGMPAAHAALAQGEIHPRPKTGATPPPRPNLRVTTTLILVPVSVNDPLNRPVSGLEKENFRLFEDKVEQTISHFSMEDEPTAVGMVFDTSGSMGEKLQRSRMAAMAFFKIANPEDEFFLVEFDSRPRLVVPLTTDTGSLETQLIFTRSRGSTALIDAIYMALHEMRRSQKNKKALLVISDGGDNHSRYTVTELKNVVRESDVLIYAVGIFGGGRTSEENSGPWLLSEIAESTGGQLFGASARELPDIAQKVGLELRNRYVLGYTPKTQARDGRYHHISVQVIPPRGLPKLRAHWRLGYVAPTD